MIVAFPVEQRLGPAPPSTNQIVAVAPLSFDRFHPRIYLGSDREKNRFYSAKCLVAAMCISISFVFQTISKE